MSFTSSRFSVSNDLKYDAERDLRDIGAKNIQVHALNKVHDCSTPQEVLTSRALVNAPLNRLVLLFSVQIWEDFLQTQWKREEGCDIRHLLFLNWRESVGREVQDPVSSAAPLVWGGL